MANCETCGLKKYCSEQGKTMGSNIDCSFYQFDENMGSEWVIKDTQKTELKENK